MSRIEETRDRDRLRRIFARDPIGAIYLLADLEDRAFAQCRWFVEGEREAVLLYAGLDVPVMLPFGETESLRRILREVDLPRRFYTKLDRAQESLLEGWRLESPDRLYVMGLEELAPTPAIAGLSCGPATDAAALAPLYQDYPGNYFHPSQVASGVYGAAYVEGVLAGAAGTHAFAPGESAAALGNVVTAARYRGRGVCRGLMHWLCAELGRRGVRHIGLHVGRGNRAAVACYRRAGFAIHSEITQWTATASRTREIRYTRRMSIAPEGRPYRFTVLALASLMTFGAHFGYDSVGAIETTLIVAFHTDRAAIGAMYSVYSIAAVCAVFFAGVLTDRVGTRRASLLFSALVVAGSAAVAAAPSLALLYAGRMIFGMGAESLMVVQSAVLARWFTGRELALSFGLMITIGRLGTLFSFNTEALVAERMGFRGALWFAAAIAAGSLACNWLYTLMDRRAEGVLKFPRTGAGDRIAWSDMRKFSPSYWYAVAICVSFYSAVFPFTALSTDLFHEKWGLAQASGAGAGFLEGVFYNFTHMFSTAQGTTSIVMAASMLLAPLAGTLVDRKGRRASVMVIGALLLIPAHLLIGLTHLAPAFPMMLLGAAFVLVPAAVWASVPLVVEESRTGTAYGVMMGMQNVGLLIFPYLNGAIRDATHSYTASQAMFAGLGGLGLVFALLLVRADRRAGGRLERSR